MRRIIPWTMRVLPAAAPAVDVNGTVRSDDTVSPDTVSSRGGNKEDAPDDDA